MTNSSGPTTEPATGAALIRTLETLAPQRARAFHDPLGKVAWTVADAPDAGRLIAEAGLAITRVNLWVLCQDDTYALTIPLADAKFGMIDWVFDSGWTPESESWGAFCLRCYQSALPFLQGHPYEPRLTPEYPAEKMRVYIEALTEREYWE